MVEAKRGIEYSTPDWFPEGENNCSNCEHVSNSLTEAKKWLPTAVDQARVKILCIPSDKVPRVKLITTASHNQLSSSSREFSRTEACPVTLKHLKIVRQQE